MIAANDGFLVAASCTQIAWWSLPNHFEKGVLVLRLNRALHLQRRDQASPHPFFACACHLLTYLHSDDEASTTKPYLLYFASGPCLNLSVCLGRGEGQEAMAAPVTSLQEAAGLHKRPTRARLLVKARPCGPALFPAKLGVLT